MLVACVGVTWQIHPGYSFDNEPDPFGASDEWPVARELYFEMAAEIEQYQGCMRTNKACTSPRKSLYVILREGPNLAFRDQLQLANRYINRMKRYRTDRRHSVSASRTTYTVRNHWSTLNEFLRRGGDCEDYATAKYQVLRTFGIPARQLRLVVVYDRTERQYHALVAAHDVAQNKGYLLDTDNRILSRVPGHYKIIYAMNEDSLWDHALESSSALRRYRKQLE